METYSAICVVRATLIPWKKY